MKLCYGVKVIPHVWSATPMDGFSTSSPYGDVWQIDEPTGALHTSNRLVRYSVKHQKPMDWDRLLSTMASGKPLPIEALAALFRPPPSASAMAQLQSMARQSITEPKSWTLALPLFLTNICELYPRRHTPYPVANPNTEGAWQIHRETLDQWIEWAHKTQADQITLYSGGLWSGLTLPGLAEKNILHTYTRVLQYLRENLPEQTLIEAFGPDEIEFLSILSDRATGYILENLKDQGLDRLGVGWADALEDSLRAQWSPKKLLVSSWKNIIQEAHRLHLPVVAPWPLGQGETPEQKARHGLRLMDLMWRFPGLFHRLQFQCLSRIKPKHLWQTLAIVRLMTHLAFESQRPEEHPLIPSPWQFEDMKQETHVSGFNMRFDPLDEGLFWGADHLGQCPADGAVQLFLRGRWHPNHSLSLCQDWIEGARERWPQKSNEKKPAIPSNEALEETSEGSSFFVQ